MAQKAYNGHKWSNLVWFQTIQTSLEQANGPKCLKMAQILQNGPKWPKMAQIGPKWPKMTQMAYSGNKWSNLVWFQDTQTILEQARQFLPVGKWLGPNGHTEKFLMERGSNFFFKIIIDPKGFIWCNIMKFWGYVFEKKWLFCIPHFAPKHPFFDPGGPISAKNLKNTMLQVVLVHRISFHS